MTMQRHLSSSSQAVDSCASTKSSWAGGLYGRSNGGTLRPFQSPPTQRLEHSRRLSRQAAPKPLPSSNEPSGIWQPGEMRSRLDPGGVASSAETDSSVADEPDNPAQDYVRRYPDPVEDDPDDPAYADSPDTAAAALAGPDLHGPLEPEPATGGGGVYGSGWRHRAAGSVIDQLRQRALTGSSSDDEGLWLEGQRWLEAEGGGQGGGGGGSGDGARRREWQSLDIPALLLSRHHAAALHSLSSSEDDTSAVPDFADQTVAWEADRAAQEAAELVPSELRPLVRAASLLGFHRNQARSRPPVGGRRNNANPAPGGHEGAQGNSGGGQAAAADASEPAPLELQEANRFSGLCEPLTDEQLEAAATIATAVPAAAAAAAGAEHEAAADPAAVQASTQRAQASTQREFLPSHGGGRTTAIAAAAAAALAEEGVDWLDVGRPGAATAATAAPSGGVGESRQMADAGPVSMDLGEERSVQLRRYPAPPGAEAGALLGDAAVRGRVAAEAARELAEAEAHVVTHHAGASCAAAAATHGSVDRFKQEQQPGGGGIGIVDGADAAAVEAAAALMAAEARRAVWGEAGWPYGAAMRSEDLVEELKHAIRQQQHESELGATDTLLP